MEGKAILFKEFGGVDAWPICLATTDPTRSSGRSRRSRRASAASTSRTSPRRAASRSSRGCARRSTSRSSTTTSTERRSSCSRRCRTPSASSARGSRTSASSSPARAPPDRPQPGCCAAAGAGEIVCCDRDGALYRRPPGSRPVQGRRSRAQTNPRVLQGSADEALAGADVFIGLSGPGAVSVDGIRTMADDAIVFAMANPTPEVAPGGDRGPRRRDRDRPLRLPESDQQRARVPRALPRRARRARDARSPTGWSSPQRSRSRTPIAPTTSRPTTCFRASSTAASRLRLPKRWPCCDCGGARAPRRAEPAAPLATGSAALRRDRRARRARAGATSSPARRGRRRGRSPPSVSQGTSKLMFSQLGCRRESRSRCRRPRGRAPVPTTIEVSAMNDDSSRKLSCTIRRRKPIARRTPICWRRSTTARAVITPSAATPTISPRPMKPSISRSKVSSRRPRRRAASAASRPACRSRGTPTRAASPSPSASTPGRSAKRCVVGSDAVAEDRARASRCDVQMPGHQQRRAVREHADHGQASRACRSAGRARSTCDGRERLVLEVEAAAAGTSDGGPKFQFALRGTTNGSTTARLRCVAERAPDGRGRGVARARARRARRSCGEERRVGAVDEVGLVLRGVPSWRALTGQRRLARDDAEVARRRSPGARASAARMSAIGAAGDVVARTSKPPPNDADVVEGVARTSRSCRADDEREDDEREHRERHAGAEAGSRSGYAIDIRSTGARRAIAAERRSSSAAEQDVGVVHDRPGRADHDHQAAEDEDREVRPSGRRRASGSIGSTNQATSASPAPVCDERGRARRARAASGTRLRITSETPRPSDDRVLARARPDGEQQAPSASADDARAASGAGAPSRAGGSGRLRIARDDVHAADAPGRERDDDEREQHADRVREHDARRLDRVARCGSRSSTRTRRPSRAPCRRRRRRRAARRQLPRSGRRRRPRRGTSARGGRGACRRRARSRARRAARPRASRRSGRSAGCRRRSRTSRRS